MSVRLRNALIPIYILSKILCIHPFSLSPLKCSTGGSILAISMAIGYSIFHLYSAKTDYASNDSKDEEKSNLVAAIIDAYNRYSGFSAFCLLIISSIYLQNYVVKAIKQLEEIDVHFRQTYKFDVDNRNWRT